MNRKEFISVTFGLAGLAAINAPLFAGIAGRKKKIQVGAHVWIYAKNQPGHDVTPVLEKIFSDMKYAGLDGVELMEHPLRNKQTVAYIAELIDQHKIPLLGTSYGASMWDKSKHNEILEDVDNIMENLSIVNGRTFGTSVGQAPGGRNKTEEELDAQAMLLRKLMKLGRKRGIVLNLHNHIYEVRNDLHDLRGTLSRIPDIKLGPDLNWLLRADVDPIWFLKEFHDNIVFMHIRDQLDDGNWPESLGEGDVDFVEIGETLREIAFKGDVVIELAHKTGFEITRPFRESLKMSRDYVQKTMGI